MGVGKERRESARSVRPAESGGQDFFPNDSVSSRFSRPACLLGWLTLFLMVFTFATVGFLIWPSPVCRRRQWLSPPVADRALSVPVSDSTGDSENHGEGRSRIIGHLSGSRVVGRIHGADIFCRKDLLLRQICTAYRLINLSASSDVKSTLRKSLKKSIVSPIRSIP